MKVYICLEQDSGPSAVFSSLDEAVLFRASHQHDDIFEIEVDIWPLEGKNKLGADWTNYPHVRFVALK